MFNRFRFDHPLTLVAFLLVILTVIFAGRMVDFNGKRECLANGYPTYNRSLTKQYCSKVVNGSSVIVPLDSIK
jgi:hypothetical protein